MHLQATAQPTTAQGAGPAELPMKGPGLRLSPVNLPQDPLLRPNTLTDIHTSPYVYGYTVLEALYQYVSEAPCITW